MPTPGIIKKEDGSIDIDKVLGDMEVISYISSKLPRYPMENLQIDVESVLAVYHLRNDVGCSSIEDCKALFVTTNRDFVRVFNEYYSYHIDKSGLPLTITASDLSAIAWVKSGEVSNEMPKKQLLMNAYMATQPSVDILAHFQEILMKLQSEGKMSQEEAVSLRESRFIKNEIMKDTFGNQEVITESFAEDMREKYKNHLLEDSYCRYEKEKREKHDLQIREANKKAIRIANEKKETWLNKRLKWIKIGSGMLILVLISCTILVTNYSTKLSFISFLATIVPVISIYDTFSSRLGIVKSFLQKKANKYETRIYEEEKKKYISVIEAAS